MWNAQSCVLIGFGYEHRWDLGRQCVLLSDLVVAFAVLVTSAHLHSKRTQAHLRKRRPETSFHDDLYEGGFIEIIFCFLWGYFGAQPLSCRVFISIFCSLERNCFAASLFWSKFSPKEIHIREGYVPTIFVKNAFVNQILSFSPKCVVNLVSIV